MGEELELGEGAGVAGADYGDLTGGGHCEKDGGGGRLEGRAEACVDLGPFKG